MPPPALDAPGRRPVRPPPLHATEKGRRVFSEGPNVLNYVQQFYTMSNAFSQGVVKNF